MASLQDLQTALINADKAGDTQAATILAKEIVRLQKQQPLTQEQSNIPLPPYQEINGQMVETPITPKKESGLIQQALGGLEALGTIATGATTGAAGQIAGTLKGAYESILGGTFGTQAGAKQIQKIAEETGQTLTYEPRTQAGQEAVEAVGKVLEPLTALTPATVEIGAATRGIKQAVPATEKIPIPKIETPEQPMTIEGIVDVAKKAATGNRAATEKLAKEVKLNPQAVDAADRLGIELPSDVLGDSELLKQTIGLVRSQVGEESANWVKTVESAVAKSDEAMSNLGKSNLAEVSGKILDDLKKTSSQLEKDAGVIYQNVTNKIPKNTEVQPVNSLNRINEIIDDIGGIKNLTKEEKSLLNLLNQEKVTFGALERERRLVGQALGKMPQGKYAQADQSLLKKVYASLKQDQLDNVESILGKDARDQLHLADRTFQRKTAIEKRIVDTFGKDGEGSVSSLLTRAVTQGAKGDITALNKVLKNVPKNMQKETLITALADATSSKRGIDYGSFDFNNFTKTYEGLQANKPIFNKLMATIGGDKKQILDDLNTISKRITEAKSKVLTTGKANQEILKQMQEEALLQRVVKFTIEKGVQKATFGGVSPSLDGLFKAPKDKLKALGDLIKSNDFYNLAKESIDGIPTETTIKKMVSSPQFKKWAKAIGSTIKEPESWVLENLILQQQGENNGSF